MDRSTKNLKPLIFTTIKRAETYLKGNYKDLTIIKCNFLGYYGDDKNQSKRFINICLEFYQQINKADL